MPIDKQGPLRAALFARWRLEQAGRYDVDTTSLGIRFNFP
jgi:hypothetical protein